MYAKVFSQIYDSSIAEDWQTRLVFMDLLILADPQGVVDMTIDSIARRTNVPRDIVEAAVCKLCKPDPESRTETADGRRLIPLDKHRSWGWQIVNFQHYHAMRDENARREYMRDYMRRRRSGPPVVNTSVNSVNSGKQQLAHAHVDTYEDKEPPIVPLSVNSAVNNASEMPEYAGVGKPIGTVEQVATAKQHMRDAMGKARTADLHMPLVPTLDRWVEGLMRDAGNGNLGLSYVLSFRPEDFIAAYAAWFKRANKGQLWTGTWVLNARNSRMAGAQEKEAAQAKDEERREAATSEQARRAAAAVLSRTRADLAGQWESLPKPDRERLIRSAQAAAPGQIGKSWKVAENTAKRLWIEEQEKANVSAEVPST